MAASIERRIFRLVLVVNVLFLGGVLAFAWWALEDLEDAMLESDRQSELQYFVENGDKEKIQRVVTAHVISAFIPRSMSLEANLPIIFEQLPVPFQGEVESLGQEYFVVTMEYPEGNFYLAKDMQQFEERETRLALYVTLLSVLVVVSCVLLAGIFSKRIALPVRRFAEQIGNLDGHNDNITIPETNVDKELNAIARAMNNLLRQVDASVSRERTLIRMASHELRTPVAVVLGAANVLESRQQLNPADQKTLQRIIVAAEEMSDNIRTLLAVVRQSPQDLKRETFDLNALLTTLVRDYGMAHGGAAERLILTPPLQASRINTDPALVRMLFNNLVGNALQHTSGQVVITQHDDHVAVSDCGIGNVSYTLVLPTDYAPTSGLGLYIVSLICEQLQWTLDVQNNAQGHRIAIYFTPALST